MLCCSFRRKHDFPNGKCFFLAKESLPASQNNPASFQYQDKNNHKKDTTANKHAKQTSGGHVGRRCNRTGMRLQLLNTTRHAIKQQPGMRTTSESEETKTKMIFHSTAHGGSLDWGETERVRLCVGETSGHVHPIAPHLHHTLGQGCPHLFGLRATFKMARSKWSSIYLTLTLTLH